MNSTHRLRPKNVTMTPTSKTKKVVQLKMITLLNSLIMNLELQLFQASLKVAQKKLKPNIAHS